MSANITRAHADMLVRKLNATVEKKRAAHDLATVYHNGKMIAMFGIRRSSSQDQGHAHIPALLNLQNAQCRNLAICNMSVDQWHDVLRGKGLLEEDPEPEEKTSVIASGSEVHILGKDIKAHVSFFNEKRGMYVCTWREDGQTKQAEFSVDQIKRV